MDSFQCCYGVYSIYTTTWFLKRVDDYHHVVSDGISSQNAQSFPDDPVTMRECLLFLLKKAADHEASYYPRVYGIDLISLTEEGNALISANTLQLEGISADKFSIEIE